MNCEPTSPTEIVPTGSTMKKILICTVGGSEMPIIHAIQQNRAGWVYGAKSAYRGGDGSEVASRSWRAGALGDSGWLLSTRRRADSSR